MGDGPLPLWGRRSGGRSGVGGERFSKRRVAAPAGLRSALGSWPRPPPSVVCPGVQEALLDSGRHTLFPPSSTCPASTAPEVDPPPQAPAPRSPAASPPPVWRAWPPAAPVVSSEEPKNVRIPAHFASCRASGWLPWPSGPRLPPRFPGCHGLAQAPAVPAPSPRGPAGSRPTSRWLWPRPCCRSCPQGPTQAPATPLVGPRVAAPRAADLIVLLRSRKAEGGAL